MDSDTSGPTPASPGCYVGVDVVDLKADGLRSRGLNRRFLDRVFTELERARIEAASDPVVETWSVWAAKEAGFKVVSKLLGSPPVFEHRAFEVVDPVGLPVATLRYKHWSLPLTVRSDPERVVVHAWNDPASLVMVSEMLQDNAGDFLGFAEPFDQWCEKRFIPAERDAIHSRASAFVRLLARRDAARLLDLPEARLSVRSQPGVTGRRPPFLYLDGEQMSAADLSFSHHGGRLAWGLILPWDAGKDGA